MAVIQRTSRAAAARSSEDAADALGPASAAAVAAVATQAPAAATTATTAAASPAPSAAHPPGNLRVDALFFAAFLAFVVSLNGLLLVIVPGGWILEFALLVWAYFIDKAAFNGKGRAIVAFRRGWWWDAVRSYFPLTMHQEHEFSASDRCLFVIHPHGVFGFSTWLSFAADAVGFSRKNHDIDVALATVNVNFYLPFWRDVLMALGFVDASFQSLSAALQRDRSVAVVLGGAAEALDAHPGTYDIILNKRKGIVRLALSTGTPMVPVFVFGESDLFYQVPNPKGSRLRKVQEAFLSYFRFSPPLFFGRGVFGCPVGPLPYAVPLHVVTGTPIPVPHIPAPTDADIAQFQRVYRLALEKLFADHEKRYYEEILPPHLRPDKRPVLRIVA